jgi:hypothetical protein
MGPRPDALFTEIVRLQGSTPWGSVLDAGTGRHSLSFVKSLPTVRWTAVTARPDAALSAFHERAEDRIVVGNWTNPSLLDGESFDTVLVDYVVGALDGFAPYFQDAFFARLRPHCRGRIYVIGLEPYGVAHDEGGAIVWEIARLRDACILLAGDRCYREYPRAWVKERMAHAGFEIASDESFPIRYGARFVDGQLDVCRRKLARIDGAVRGALAARIENVAARAHGYLARVGEIRFGEDYVIGATVKRV